MPSKPIRRLMIVAGIVVGLWTQAFAFGLIYAGWALAVVF